MSPKASMIQVLKAWFYELLRHTPWFGVTQCPGCNTYTVGGKGAHLASQCRRCGCPF